jgi:hypothetical protein
MTLEARWLCLTQAGRAATRTLQRTVQ